MIDDVILVNIVHVSMSQHPCTGVSNVLIRVITLTDVSSPPCTITHANIKCRLNIYIHIPRSVSSSTVPHVRSTIPTKLHYNHISISPANPTRFNPCYPYDGGVYTLRQSIIRVTLYHYTCPPALIQTALSYVSISQHPYTCFHITPH